MRPVDPKIKIIVASQGESNTWNLSNPDELAAMKQIQRDREQQRRMVMPEVGTQDKTVANTHQTSNDINKNPKWIETKDKKQEYTITNKGLRMRKKITLKENSTGNDTNLADKVVSSTNLLTHT